MQTNKILSAMSLGSALLAASLMNSPAQTTATWIGPTSGGEWNTAANWDAGVPGVGTNAVIGSGNTVDYSEPMAAPSFLGLTLSNALINISTNGFAIDAAGGIPLTLNAGGFLTIQTNGAVTITDSGSVTLPNPSSGASPTIDVEGGSLLLTNNSGTFVFGDGASKDTYVGAVFTNNGGAVVMDEPLRLRGRDTRFYMSGGTLDLQGGLDHDVSQNDSRQFFTIAGGTANLNDVTINRATTSGGLSIAGGVVNSSSIRIGIGVASANARMNGGVWTNAGEFYIGDRNNAATSGSRQVYFTMNNGNLVTSGTNGIVINNQGESSTSNLSNNGGSLTVNGGTITAEGIYLNGPSVTQDSYARFQLAGGTIYLGSVGVVANTAGSGMTAVITLSGGTLAANADYAISGNVSLSGGMTTLQSADADGNPFDISASGVWSGAGGLDKTGGGTLLMSGANTYAGNTLIDAGTFALDVSASLASPLVLVAPGATFDVSALGGSYALNAGQTLSGMGVVTGAVNVASTAIINPGSNQLTGTLTFSNDVVETGGAVNHFDLPNDATSPDNDALIVGGTFTASGANTIEVSGATTSGAYKLIQYGAFSGDVSSFSVSGITGTLSNSVTAKAIYLVISTSLRAPTNVVWIGNAASNVWDAATTTNWLNAGALDLFVPGDNVRFDDTGAANPLVTIAGSVAPGSVTVDAAADYTFDGGGLIGGLGGLLKTNTGTLTILTTNTYTGATLINGGVLAVAQVANGGLASPIGAASSDPANLVIGNGTLGYSGPNDGMDRGLTLAGDSSAIAVSANGNLTLSGTLVGTGALDKMDTGTLILSGANAYTGPTVLSNGTLQVNSTVSALSGTVAFAGGTLSLNVSGQPTYSNPLNVADTGTLISSGGNNNIVNGAWAGTGLLNLDIASGYFTIDGNMTTNFTGTIRVTDDSTGTFRFNAGGGDPCTGSPYAAFDLGNGSVILGNRNGSSYGTTNYYLGALAGGSSTTLRGAFNTGTPNNYVIGGNNQDSTFAGTIANGSGGGGAVVSIVKTGSGTLTLEGPNSFTGTTTVSNGVLALANNPNTGIDGALDSSAAINVAAGAILDVSGRSDGSLNVNNQLRGRGTIRGMVNVIGTVSPGGGTGGTPGTLTVTNAVNLYGTAWMKLNRASTPNSDRLVSTLGTITYGGTLVVTNIGARLQPGDTFTLFSGGGLSAGAFNLQLPNYYTWDTSQLGVNGSISVTATFPPPAITNVDFSGLAGGSVTLNAINGAPNGPVNVLSTTNLALPLSSWTTVINTTFDGSGNLNLPISVDPNAPQSYFLLQAY